MSRIIVTGASGYIGGHTALKLKEQGHYVVGIDHRQCPDHLNSSYDEFLQEDFSSTLAFDKIFDTAPQAIVHCAGTSLVGTSIAKPDLYYSNNVVKTLALLDQIRDIRPKTKFIFSSSAAVYGEPIMTPCHEVDPKEPISPYGESKLMIEMMLESYRKAYGLDYVAFRYFNACGADPQGRHGQEPDATHIIARVLECLRDNKDFNIYGSDYPTADGTCIRDYVHVDDIANAHALALNSSVTAGVYNLSTGTGQSKRDIIAAAEQITGRKLKVFEGQRRPGDPPELTASADKFARICPDWRKYDLDDMITHAWNWYNR